MSLFDVIKYPITDIYKEEELQRLPKDLFDSWAEFVGIASTGDSSRVSYNNNRSALIQYLLALGEILYNKDETFLKEYVTYYLRERIREYEPL